MTATKDDQISTKTQFLFKCWIVKITSNFEQRGEKKKENIKHTSKQATIQRWNISVQIILAFNEFLHK